MPQRTAVVLVSAVFATSALAFATTGCSSSSGGGSSGDTGADTSSADTFSGDTGADDTGGPDVPAPDVVDDQGNDTRAADVPGDGPESDGSDDPEIPTECADVTCGNGGSCVVVADVGVCDCPAGTSGSTCEVRCESELLTPTFCSVDGADDCLGLFSESAPAGFGGACGDSGVPCDYDDAECADGCVRFALYLHLEAEYWVDEIWWRADWWNKRPSVVSIYTADDGSFGNATLVAELAGQPNPWQCVSGQACTEEVPDECCPDGRDAPQRIDDGALISLWDIARFEGDLGQYWIFAVDETYEPRFVELQQMQLYGHQCPAGLGCDPTVEECGVPTGGCDAEPCYDGVACTDRPGETPAFECGECPSGREGNGISCLDINGCADSPCYPGVVCTDVAAPGTGFSCGPCPSGTTGDGITCTPDSCEPACAEWQVCNGGTCRPKSCSSDGGCPGGYCFEGACRGDGASCTARCATVYGGGHTWECNASYCFKDDCNARVDCPSGYECVSDSSSNPRGLFDKTCVADGSSPCGGTCTFVCSAYNETCIGG